MEIIRDNVSIEEVIASWVRHEYGSRSDFKKSVEINAKETLPYLYKKDFEVPESNDMRRKALACSIRGGYARDVLLSSGVTEWKIARLTITELNQLKGVNCGNVRILSDESLLIADMVNNILTKPELKEHAQDDVKRTATDVTDKAEQFAETQELPIAIGTIQNLTIVEGLHRTLGTVIYRKDHTGPAFRDIYVGICSDPFTKYYR